ncbi:DUF1259 domain-containing protein [Oceanobacillus piezotolerans]|uniref:DUF1259 domain-containing protein n=1 Tax=Oceanobacillus piezotolerans TaxID=2448030 RepID=A0A498D2R1_9BACI|nr:DUF1259 domain-containing protein [Oceanobacillus piezotolerans]
MEAQLEYEGNALNLGEKAVLEALHNHWLYTKPNILYIHFQSVEPPLHFARKVAEAFQVLDDVNSWTCYSN